MELIILLAAVGAEKPLAAQARAARAAEELARLPEVQANRERRTRAVAEVALAAASVDPPLTHRAARVSC